jgi:hypothetical protein
VNSMLIFLGEIIFLLSFLIPRNGCEDFSAEVINSTLLPQNGCQSEEQCTRNVFWTTTSPSSLMISDCSMKKLCNNIFNITNIFSDVYVFRCNIEEIEENILRDLPISHTFSITSNPITIIKKHTFQNHDIETIDLSFNKIKIIENESFVNLTELQKISLVDNLIQYVNPEAFLNLENLVYLLLTGNKIERIGRSAFHFLHKDGATIVLNENYITTVDVKAFEHFTPKDAIISLQYNLITTLPQGLFDNRTFKRIDLSFNKIPAKPKNPFCNNCSVEQFIIINESVPNENTTWEPSQFLRGNVPFFPENGGSGGESKCEVTYTVIIFGLCLLIVV